MVANVAVSEFTWSAFVVWIIQMLKKASWFPWLQAGMAKASRVASALLALAGTVGIQWEWNVMPNGTHSLLLSGLSWSAIGLGLWHWMQHMALQETIYQATANRKVDLPAAPPAPAVQP